MIKKKLLRILLVAFCFSVIPLSFIYAVEEYPWVKVDSGIVRDIYYDASSGSVYLVTEDRGVLRSGDTGVTWVVKNSGIAIEDSENPYWPLRKIVSDGSGNIFLSTCYKFYRSSNRGDTWQEATATGYPTGTGGDVQSLAFDPYTGKLFLISNSGGMFRSSDLGETWERINAGTDNVYSIYAGKADASGATGMLLAGTYFNGIIKSTNGGDAWAGKGSTYWMEDIISGPSDWLFAISDSRIDRSQNYGESWETIYNSPQGKDLAYDAVTGFLYASNGSNYLLRSADGGDSWGTVQITTDDTEYTREVEVLPNSVVIVGTQKSIYRQGPVVDTNDTPSIPALTSPANGYRVYGTSVKLYWQKSTDPEGGGVTYRLQVAEDADFTVNLREFTIDENGVLLPAMMLPFLFLIGWGARNGRKQTSVLMIAAMLLMTSFLVGCGSDGWNANNRIGDENTISYEVAGLEAGKTYYWRVIAVDENDEPSDPSETRSFIVN